MDKLEEPPELTLKQKIAFLGMIVGIFMAILDIQIVASSLSVIGAGLNATLDELSWVQTAYIIAEVVIIPLTGFTAKLLSTRVSYTIATLGFTVMSIFCALAWNIESMIIFRAFQGIFGGAMIPTVFGTIYRIFPRHQQPMVTIAASLVITIAPTLGPIIGGYITEVISWHFMFLINVIPGAFVCSVVFLYGDFDKPDYSLLKRFDFAGVAFLVISLGCLQYVLEEGTKEDWFESTLIINLTIVVIVSFIALIIREFTYDKPVLDIFAFKNRNFSIGCIYSMILGVGLFGTTFLMPIFLSRVSELNTLQIGIIMCVTGASQFVSAPIAGALYKTGIDGRIMLFFGLLMFGSGCYLNGFLTPESRFSDLMLPQIIRGLSLMFCFVPINDLTLGTMSKEEVQNASGLYNLMRNLGGATGLAIINSNIIDSTKINQDILGSNLTATNPQLAGIMENFSNMLNSPLIPNSEKAAYMFLGEMLNRDAFVIAINNVFMGIGILIASGIFLLPFTSNVRK